MTKQKEETVLEQVVDQEAVEKQAEVEVKPQEEQQQSEVSKNTIDEDGTIKIDLRKNDNLNPTDEKVEEEVKEEKEEEVTQVLQEVTDEEVGETVEQEVEKLEDQVEQALVEADAGIDLPENIQKVVDFINETGGSLEDYVNLNKNYEDIDDIQLLKEYYKVEKPYLDSSDIDLLLEDFSYDSELDDERTVKKAKLAFKEEVNKAKQSLNKKKDKYYEEIKAGSKLTSDQQKAVDFFNRYKEENEEVSKIADKQSKIFLNKTEQVFSDKFKGFEYNVGEKRFRFNVKNANEVKQSQSDINNFVKKFLTDDNTMGDAKGYHKALFTAMNSDAIANHFYEQGKADAIKQSISRSKNVDMKPRGVHEKTTDVGGTKYRVVSGDDSSSLKIKIKK